MPRQQTTKLSGGKKKSPETEELPARAKRDRALQMKRWPEYAQQIARDIFVEKLSLFLSAEKEVGSEFKDSQNRRELSRLLKGVTESWHKRLLEHWEFAAPEGRSDATKIEQHEEQKELQSCELNLKSLPTLLFWARRAKMLDLQPQTFPQDESPLVNRYKCAVRVFSGSSRNLFAARAAAEFATSIWEVGKTVWSPNTNLALNIGVVSGSTVESVVEAMIRSTDWEFDYGINPSLFGNISVIALNVCLTQRDVLSYNATILAHSLSKKITEQIAAHGGKANAEPYGLSTDLLVIGDDKRAEVDHGPETKAVVAITQPGRLLSKTENKVVPSTELHLVLTSIGEPKSSMFGKFSDGLTDKGVDMNKYKGRIAGDILYNPFDHDGNEIDIKTEQGDSVRFYSAIDLSTLEAMARNPAKKVILVARREKEKDKISAIHAAMARHHRYASLLITDEYCARELATR